MTDRGKLYDRLVAALEETLAELRKDFSESCSTENIDIRDCVLYNSKSGRYQVSIMIQDGYESCGDYATRTEAVCAYIDAQAVWNGNRDLTPNDVAVYSVVEAPIITHKYKRI